MAKSPAPWINLAANTLPQLGNLSPEKWEGLAIGPRLADGGYLILAGTDNDYSVTQNASGVQFDVYFNFLTGQRLECALGVACAPASEPWSLLPGVLHAYLTTAGDAVMARYVAPVPEPAAATLALTGFALLFLAGGRKRSGRT